MMAKKNNEKQNVTEENFFLENTTLLDEFLSDAPEMPMEGELAVDLYETAKEIVIKAPIAGVNPGEIDITITDDMVMIRGERKEEREVEENAYQLKECYWGAFSRTVNLPVKGLPDEAKADFNNGILTVKIPKAEVNKLRKLKVNLG